MKKSIFSIAMCVSVLLTVSSCSHDDLMSNKVIPQKTESSTNAKVTAAAATSWTYQTLQWQALGGNVLNRDFNAYGTNQSSKRATITVSNDSFSASNVTVKVYALSSNNVREVDYLVSFPVNKGQNVNKIIDVAGLNTNLTKLRVSIETGTTQTCSGMMTFGYEQ